MADIQYYERVLKKQGASARLLPRLLMIAAYVVLLSVWFVIVVRIGLSASLLMLIPFSVLTVVLITWKYTSVEYEYSFTAGVFVFSKIYGASGRKNVFEADLRALVSAEPLSEGALARVGVTPTDARVLPDSPNDCLLVFSEHEKKSAVIIECDQMTVKILRFFKPSAVSTALWGVK